MTTIIDGTSGVTYPTGTNQKGSLTLGTAKNTTSGTFVDFTDIPSWAKRITVMFNGVSTNGTSNWLVQMGTLSGFESTTYSSYASLAGSAATSTAGMIFNSGSAANICSGTFIFSNVNANSWVCSHVMVNPAGPNSSYGGGTKTLSGTLDRIRITTVNGTDLFDAGSVNIMYE